MNEQILKLAQEAGLTSYTKNVEAMLTKFSELIVRDCINEVYPEWMKNEEVDAVNLGDAVTRVKEHFGVKDE